MEKKMELKNSKIPYYLPDASHLPDLPDVSKKERKNGFLRMGQSGYLIDFEDFLTEASSVFFGKQKQVVIVNDEKKFKFFHFKFNLEDFTELLSFILTVNHSYPWDTRLNFINELKTIMMRPQKIFDLHGFTQGCALFYIAQQLISKYEKNGDEVEAKEETEVEGGE